MISVAHFNTSRASATLLEVLEDAKRLIPPPCSEVAATVPARPRMKPKTLKHRVREAVSEVPTDASSREVLGEAYTHRRIAEVERVAKAGTTPLRP